MSQFEVIFTKNIPKYNDLKENTLYVSLEYAIAIHKCACGCGNEVATPLSRVDWILTFDGDVTLYPSIGNWNLPCRSHYFIRDSKVEWVKHYMKEKTISKNRKKDKKLFKKHFNVKRDK